MEMTKNNNDAAATIFPELILMAPKASTEELLKKPENLPLRILFYQPDEPELEGKEAAELKELLENTRRRSWERTDYVQNPPEAVRKHMMGVCVTGYTNIEGVPSKMVYNLKHTLANRGPAYLDLLKDGIPGSVIELEQGEDGSYIVTPDGGACFWFDGKLYQFAIRKYQIQKS